jgi:hypothetical protein
MSAKFIRSSFFMGLIFKLYNSSPLIKKPSYSSRGIYMSTDPSGLPLKDRGVFFLKIMTSLEA